MARRSEDERERDVVALAPPDAVRIAGAWSRPPIVAPILAGLVRPFVILLHVVVLPVLVAVPFTAAANSAVEDLAGGAWKDEPPPPVEPMPAQPERGGRAARRRRRRAERPEDVTTVA